MGGVCGGGGADSSGMIGRGGCSGFNTGPITEAVGLQELPYAPRPKLPRWLQGGAQV